MNRIFREHPGFNEAVMSSSEAKDKKNWLEKQISEIKPEPPASLELNTDSEGLHNGSNESLQVIAYLRILTGDAKKDRYGGTGCEFKNDGTVGVLDADYFDLNSHYMTWELAVRAIKNAVEQDL